MKGFLKIVFGTMVGIGLWCVLAFLILIISLAGMSASESATTSVRKGSVLRINLTGVLDERAGQQSPLDLIQGDTEAPLALDQLKEAIAEAAKNDKIEGIYLEIDAFAGGTPATLQELRQALVKFKKDSGKWIVAYGDAYNQSAYYLASVADQIAMNPEGMLDWHGLASASMFFTDAAKKLGVKFQVFKVGTYKSAVEPYILRLSQPAYYRHPAVRGGYLRGQETYDYVRQIHERWAAYRRSARSTSAGMSPRTSTNPHESRVKGREEYLPH